MASAEEMPPTRRPNRSRTQRTPRNPARTLARCAVKAMTERKALNIVVMDLRDASGSVADYFVLATGGSDRQIRAIASAVQQDLKETCSERPWHTEGLEHLQWVVLDYVDVVVHVFNQEKRDYYDLERLWADARIERVPTDGEVAEVDLLRPPVEQRTPSSSP